MESLLESTSLAQRAHWLIRLRWVAIASLGCATFGASEFMGVSLPAGVLYGIAAVLLLYNLTLRQTLVYWPRAGPEASEVRIGGVLALVQNKAQGKSISLSHRIDSRIDTIWGEAVLIEETIANILLNAVKYTPGGGKVSLEAGVGGDSVWIRVADTGIGVPEGDDLRIFDEFYRVQNARETERDGTGLGLAFARQVVKRHGGRIWVEGNPGGGSVFTFTLPVRPPGGGG